MPEPLPDKNGAPKCRDRSSDSKEKSKDSKEKSNYGVKYCL
jgi:hypothetical protein